MSNDNHYNKPTTEREMRDLAMIARGMLRISRCPGGRLSPYGYTCVHCGVDFEGDEDGFCGQPLHEDGMTPFDATVARRIMRESADKYREEEQ